MPDRLIEGGAQTKADYDTRQAKVIHAGQELAAGGRPCLPADEDWDRQFMQAMLEDELAPRQVRSLNDLGVPADAKEAVAFAVLANETLMGRAGNVTAATGAGVGAVLGKISLPSV